MEVSVIRKEKFRREASASEWSSGEHRAALRRHLVEALLQDLGGVLQSGVTYVVAMEIGEWRFDDQWRLQGQVIVSLVEFGRGD